MDYEKLLPYCISDTQREVVEAVVKYKSQRKAAKHLGRDSRGVERLLKRVRSNAARHGYSPMHDMTHTTPDGYIVKGTSTLYGDDGNMKIQWVKSDIDKERQIAIMQEVVQGFIEEIPNAIPVSPPAHTSANLLNVYTITDFHFGMLSWPEETGAEWNMQIAEETLLAWFSAAIRITPKSDSAIFAQIGDFLHWDGFEAVTPAHRHVLDADTRFQKLVRSVIKCIRVIINQLLQKHKYVHVIMADANHDPASGVWLREMLAAFYDLEPRVTVDNSADSYYCYEWGLTSLFWHHGHKRKPESIDDVFVSKFREVFGRTKHSYAHMGHMHYNKLLETNLMTVEQHRTLAAKDAYASKGGWMSGRDAKCITYSKEFGEVSRVTVSPEMLK